MTRKARKKSKEVDVMIPVVNILAFGSENDPCFGKHNDPTANECKRCGDCELCAIVQAQRMHKVRDKESKKYPLKDLEEPNMDLVTVERFVLKNLKKGPKSLKEILEGGFKYFANFEKHTREESDKFLLAYIVRSAKLKRFKKEGIKYIKLA